MSSVSVELKWLSDHPKFIERPATVIEFLGPNYLNIEDQVRESIKDALREIIGDEVDGRRITREHLAIFTGAIGIGKTTLAAIILPYCVHWTLCLRDPQRFFGLLPGSRIAFMQMSTSEQQALEVVFGDIKARIEWSPWFKDHPTDPKYKKQLRFEKDIWVIPGDSAETTFEGYNILGGILDEADSHKVVVRPGVPDKDYAEIGFDTIQNRVTSRFQNRGFTLIIGQMKSGSGFAARKYTEFRRRPDAYAKRMTIWESMGEEFYRDDTTGKLEKFGYDIKRKAILPEGVANLLLKDGAEEILMIPKIYEPEFVTNPEKALKDLAGVPPAVGDPFISQVDRIESCRDRWLASNPGVETPVDPNGRIAEWFKCPTPIIRAAHVDIAYAEQGDALGIALGHVRELVEIEGELKPYIVIDFLMRMTAPPGGEVYLSDMRRVIYDLIDEYGFRIKGVTFDGFQSQDTIQQFHKRRLEAELLSIDKQKLPYEDLRDAIYERRIEWPFYRVEYRRGDIELTEIMLKEVSELVDNVKKVDHPAGGSKDVADAVAGVVTTLMGDRRYRRGVQSVPTPLVVGNEATSAGGGTQFTHPALHGLEGLMAPVPPRIGSGWRR